MRFDRVLLLEQTAETSANVSFGDLNGDGRVDVMLAKGRHWPLVDQVLLNDGSGTFRARPLSDVADKSYSGLLVDFDLDGDLDVLISNDRPDPQRLYLNDGRGNFTLGSTLGTPEWSIRNASVADLNGDRLPDIVFANRTGDSRGSNYVCLNRGGGKFDSCVSVARESTTTITPADFNRDGAIDLAVPHREGGQSLVYLNDGKAAFSKTVPFGPPTARIRVSAAADLNGDTLMDLAVIDERTGPALYFQQPGGSFGVAVALGDGKLRPYALAVADLNSDGKPDVIVGNVEAPTVAYFNDGTWRSFKPVTFGDAQGTAYGIAVADADGDGVMDIAVARSEAPNVLYFGSR
jgi:hypothetical protein